MESRALYIVDAMNVLFRAYYAIHPMTNVQGESTNALYGFIRSIYKTIERFSPDYFVAVFDGPENKKSRTAIYKDYKSHRAKMPEDLSPQLENALKFCDIAGVPHLSISGVEADDAIGSIAKWAEGKGANVFICSGDKDLCQLVNDHIFLINLYKEDLLIDRKKVKELFGVNPEQMIDFLAIAGDSSDNIPGLEGFGPKTAISLLNQFGSLENILAHPEKLSGKKKEVLIQGKEIALLSQQLATIQLDVDVPKDSQFFQLKTPDIDQVKGFYQEMGFMSLLRELGNSEREEVKPSHPKGRWIQELKELEKLIEDLKKYHEICIDTETTGVDPLQAQLVGIGIGAIGSQTTYIPVNQGMKKEEVIGKLKSFLEDPDRGVIGHNLKYDLHILLNEGVHIEKVSFDTMLASYLISPNSQRHNLDVLTFEKFGKVKISIESLIGKGKNQSSMAEVPIEKICEYCCQDVDDTLGLKAIFDKELKKLSLATVFQEIELPLIPILMKMERNGIFVDKAQLEKLSVELDNTLRLLEEKIYELAEEKFNLNSPKQLSAILFEKMQIKPPKKTATGYSTAADVLETLQNSHPIVKEVLQYRTLEKLRSTYVDSLPEAINPSTGRIHCTFNQSVAATGRLSCQNPNLQNIPVRTREGKRIRYAFCPQSSHYRFLSADYSQVELRLLAHLSEDPVLITAFQEGEDVHAYTAALMFNLPISEVSPQMRDRAKAVNFGILYGQSPFGLSQELGIDYQEAVSFIETYFLRYKKVKEFLVFCKETVRESGRAVTLTGRQRPIPEICSKNPMVRAAAERLAINTPLQGTAADLIKIAMIRVDQYLEKNPNQGMMILQIHDELLFESPNDQVESFSTQVKGLMEGVFSLKVPLTVDISIGKNWGEC